MKTRLIVGALGCALRQLGDPRLIAPLLGAFLVVVFLTAPVAGLFVGIAWLIESLTPAEVALPGVGRMSFLGAFTEGLASRAGWSFFAWVTAPLVLATVGLFLERIVEAVERRHYPALPAPRRRGMGEAIMVSLRLLWLTALVSVAAFLASLAAGWLSPLVFLAANGWLIAREYFETVALRRLSPAEAARLARAEWPTLWAAGVVVALGLAVPLVNLLAPVIGAAAFTHLFHSLARAAPSG
ncbi:Etoposide-induced protein 2.4 (EI24) [Meinhardsimonia xiamenensis]|uniref:Etoposide-induced protein 2.4 (EI24) n=1 Tax=Meinhardsimonia xiamenensis TaxID=990712 RepID=A0A1G9EJM5_9RHOB|nr:EI24 domain-containing protein [Meinhardsimonia xiamenensis]PRX33738.1 etoposide-induced protein 2.4 (EI24) [Meinhardsimonia xiamenensis]SDK76360.1 Etoposide-induced protein 2.4 (EI24) [Meinhardsimonia xiamenensis]